MQDGAIENHPVQKDEEEVRWMFQLCLGVPCVWAASPERDDIDDGQDVPEVFLAHSICQGQGKAMEALHEPQMPGEGKMKCKVCTREAVADLCRYHSEARDNLQAAYPLWVRAYGSLKWKDYLDSVKHNLQTGQWAKEIAEFLSGD